MMFQIHHHFRVFITIGTVRFVSDVQFLNTSEPMLIILGGITTSSMLEHPLKVSSFISLIPVGITIFPDIFPHPLNACFPRDVTLLMSVNFPSMFEHPLNAPSPISVTDFGIIIDFILSQSVNI